MSNEMCKRNISDYTSYLVLQIVEEMIDDMIDEVRSR